MTVTHTGSTESYAMGWETIFAGNRSTRKVAAKKKATGPKTRKTSRAKVSPKKKAARAKSKKRS